MRISDWSSDVCSSDLTQVLFTPDAGFSGDGRLVLAADDGYGSSAEAVIAVAVSDAPLLALDFYARELHLDSLGQQGPTGRAPCRESVCQSVQTSAVAAAANKTPPSYPTPPTISHPTLL